MRTRYANRALRFPHRGEMPVALSVRVLPDPRLDDAHRLARQLFARRHARQPCRRAYRSNGMEYSGWLQSWTDHRGALSSRGRPAGLARPVDYGLVEVLGCR